MIAVGNKKLKLINIETLEKTEIITGFHQIVNLQFSYDGESLAIIATNTVDDDDETDDLDEDQDVNAVLICNLDNPTELRKIKQGEFPFWYESANFSSADNLLTLVGNTSIHIYDVETLNLISQVRIPPNHIISVSKIANIACLQISSEMQILDFTLSENHKVALPYGKSSMFTPNFDGSIIAYLNDNHLENQLRFFDVNDPENIKKIVLEDEILRILFTNAGKEIIVITENYVIEIYNLTSLKKIKEINLLDLTNPENELRVYDYFSENILNLAISSDDSTLFLLMNSLFLIDLDRGDLISIIEIEKDIYGAMTVRPDFNGYILK